MYKLTFLLALLIGATQISSAGMAETLLDKALNELGGKEKLSNINSLVLEYDVIMMGDTSASKMIVKDSAYAIHGTIMGVESHIIYNGNEGWIKSAALQAPNWQKAPQMIFDQLGGQYDFQRQILFSLLADIDESDTLSFGGMQKFNDESVKTLKVIPSLEKMGTPTTLYTYIGMNNNLIKGHKLVIDLSGTPQAAMGKIEIQVNVSDYREINGMKIPYNVSLNQAGQGQTFIYNKIEINGDVSDSEFANPMPKEDDKK
jgi:hypothetical protein